MPMDNTHDHSHRQTRTAVIPTSDKLRADPLLTGRGVTIAFLDSGFYPHPDIAGRIAAYHDVTGAEPDISKIEQPDGHHWHGTQTVVACAGDGKLSDGTYRGLASGSQLALIKVSDRGRIPDANIEAGLRWAIANRERYGIRILNMSLGGDEDLASNESEIDRLAAELVAAGVVVTVAAGNSDATHSLPPANSPNVITVGGSSDENRLGERVLELYHSSYGATRDGIVKPEVIAPAMYVAAPILPGTPDFAAAEALAELAAAPEYRLPELMEKIGEAAGLGGLTGISIDEIRRAAEHEIVRRRIVSTHYQHVDGTSFAAPIAASVAAQMLECNPALTPAAVKNILISTARKIAGRPSLRQGFGVIDAGAATELAKAESHALDTCSYFPPRVEERSIVFTFHDDAAGSVDVCGDWNAWRRGVDTMTRRADGLWTCETPCRPSGVYRYKFLIDGERWTEDPSHGFKEDDGFGGVNSLLRIGGVE